MATDLQLLLKEYRSSAKDQREKGTYFELLIKDFLKKDPRYAPQFVDVFTYAEWAGKQGINKTDDGIDLVAEMPNDEGFCAIQCKFYAEDHAIQKSDIDSFFTASGKKPFTRRLFIDTTRKDWSKNAEMHWIISAFPFNGLVSMNWKKVLLIGVFTHQTKKSNTSQKKN